MREGTHRQGRTPVWAGNCRSPDFARDDKSRGKQPLTGKLYICRVATMKLRLSPQTLQVLDAFLREPVEWKYGYDISRNTGLKSGTLYPILMRMAERKLLETGWEAAEAGKPPRHLYRLTADG